MKKNISQDSLTYFRVAEKKSVVVKQETNGKTVYYYELIPNNPNFSKSYGLEFRYLQPGKRGASVHEKILPTSVDGKGNSLCVFTGQFRVPHNRVFNPKRQCNVDFTALLQPGKITKLVKVSSLNSAKYPQELIQKLPRKRQNPQPRQLHRIVRTTSLDDEGDVEMKDKKPISQMRKKNVYRPSQSVVVNSEDDLMLKVTELDGNYQNGTHFNRGFNGQFPPPQSQNFNQNVKQKKPSIPNWDLGMNSFEEQFPGNDFGGKDDMSPTWGYEVDSVFSTSTAAHPTNESPPSSFDDGYEIVEEKFTTENSFNFPPVGDDDDPFLDLDFVKINTYDEYAQCEMNQKAGSFPEDDDDPFLNDTGFNDDNSSMFPGDFENFEYT